MRLKTYLLNEAGADSGSDWFYGNMLLPSDAFDWQYAQPYPSDFLLLQSRWKKEKIQGRKFHNLDLKNVLKTKFTSIYSNTMPDGPWKHQADIRPNLTIDNNAKLEVRGINKSASADTILYKTNPMIDKSDDLDRLFQKFEAKYPKMPNFNKPWRHKYTENLTPYTQLGPGQDSINVHMGVKSKYVGPDDTGEGKSNEKIPMADFGFEHPKYMKKSKEKQNVKRRYIRKS
jgi:hypothetical protein